MPTQLTLVVTSAVLSFAVAQAVASDSIGEIKQLDGAAMITQGERFVAAQEGMPLQELDRLMVLEQSEALIEFTDGCRHVLKEKELLTIGATSVCAEQAAANQRVDHAAVQRTATSAVEAGDGPDVGLYIFGALALGGLITGLTNESETTRPLPFTSPQ
ncbi:hypothetical protein CKO25_18290 [Thiocapsa imhoffii]|uniref:Uncharacterized protein n=1 Tax=Thiocapsa imhoffii TaxID=382777 RepID=A0A9X0WL22_9GAMM|nr:hypothetical protein [Thiocapsa imhoffii]MBK1646558.1 hypothetical protein [Thiocapsa imhoffii]